VTPTPARLRLRRRLLIYSAPLTIAALLVAAKLISVVVAGNSAVSAFAGGDGSALRTDATVLRVVNIVEPAKAPFAAGVAALLEGRLADADGDFSDALARTDAAGSCPARVNLELVRETQGDRAATAGDPGRASDRYGSALTVVDGAPATCFSHNTDPDAQRRAIRNDTRRRLEDKRAALTAAPQEQLPAPPLRVRVGVMGEAGGRRPSPSRPTGGRYRRARFIRPMAIRSTSCSRCCRTRRAHYRPGTPRRGLSGSRRGRPTRPAVPVRQ
ncbi:Mycobacterium rhizamassiliense ORFan, partial [Mycobacterium rhizamassiliense]